MENITEEQIREAAKNNSRGMFTSTNAAADYETGFEAGAKWAMSQDQWVSVDPDVRSELAQKVETIDSKLIQCLFDDGSICSYDDEWPFAVCTHMYFLPSPSKKGANNG